MPTVNLSSRNGGAFETGQFDWQGNRVPRGQETRVCIGAPIEATSPDRDINLAFYVWGEVPLELAKTVADERSRPYVIADAMLRSKALLLPRQLEWQVHGKQSVVVSEQLLNEPGGAAPRTIDVEVLPLCYEFLKQETARRRETEKAFDKAKDFLFQTLEHPIYGDSSPILRAAGFITRCAKAGFEPFEVYMDTNYVDQLNDSIEDMLRRSQHSHPGYQRSRRQAHDASYSVHCPRYWMEQPPSASLLSL